MLKKLKNLYPHQTLISIFIIGLVIVCSSIIVQYVFKVHPCEMCYWQRYLALGITVVAFTGTLFRGRIKKKFLAVISLLAFASAFIGGWQSLAQAGLLELNAVCQGVETLEQTTDKAATPTDGAKLLEDLKNNTVEYIDCSVPEDFFLYNIFGITLANVNTVLMLLIGSFAFYKLFFVPRKRYRRYNNRYRNNRGSNRRYRGSGYRRANNRNNRRPNNNRYHNNRNRSNYRNNNNNDQ